VEASGDPGYVRRTMDRAVDVEALAEALARIQGLVDEEFRCCATGRRAGKGHRSPSCGAAGARIARRKASEGVIVGGDVGLHP